MQKLWMNVEDTDDPVYRKTFIHTPLPHFQVGCIFAAFEVCVCFLYFSKAKVHKLFSVLAVSFLFSNLKKKG